MQVSEWLGKENQIGIDIWEKKYRFGDESFDQWLERVSAGDPEVKQLIVDKKFLFGGRILANRGLSEEYGKRVMLSNCVVITPPEDNIESIFDCAKKLARTYSLGGGCGVDISKLSPRGAKINNAAKTTSGAVSFMDLYSLVTGLIGQAGRRGALMISIACDHPDVEEFIHIKSDLTKITYANISVRASYTFMQAVKYDKDFVLKFTREETGEEITKVVKAKNIFHMIAESNWNMGEPGLLFWDRIENWNLLQYDDNFKFSGTNPCAEEPLPSGGTCLLGSLNLSEYVIIPFTKDACIDTESLFRDARTATRALNSVLNEGIQLLPLEEQKECAANWRQIGLGIFGLADMLIKCGVTYGDPVSIDLCKLVSSTILNGALTESSELSRRFRSYPCYDKQSVLKSDFINSDYVDEATRNGVKLYGLRNSQLLTIAPTGTLSTMLGVSGGIEPIFANSYTRTTKSLDNADKDYKIYTPIVEKYMRANNISNESDLPEYFVTAKDIPFENRIEMQATWQQGIDASISSTINLPHDATVEQVEDIYMLAWEKGLKGITVFRDGCERTGILNADKPAERRTDASYETLPRGAIEDVPEGLTYRKYKIHSGCGKLYLFVGIDEYEGKIYDVFTNTDGSGGCSINTQANSRLLSACIRGGIPLEYVVEQLQKAGTCPSYQYAKGKGRELSVGKSCPSAIAHILTEVMKEFGSDTTGAELHKEKQDKTVTEKPSTSKCPECGAAVMHDGGCLVCNECGWSKCS